MARNKKPASSGDMVRTLLVILVPLVIITVFFSRYLDDYPVQEVDWQSVLAQAREQAPYPVLAPKGLPGSWRPTQVTWVKTGQPHLNDQPSARNLWQIGYLDPSDVYISVNQGDARPEDFISDTTRDGVVDGRSAVGDQSWVRYVSDDERTRSLVWSTPEVTTIVVGDTTYEALEAFAGTLSAT
ncbi:DUF4245 domain-containing protein [Microlunatus aurantiacus]